METLHPIKDAAARLGISVWTLRKKAYEGDIDSIKIGVKLLIPESEIQRLILEGMRRRRSVRAAEPPAQSAGTRRGRDERERAAYPKAALRVPGRSRAETEAV